MKLDAEHRLDVKQTNGNLEIAMLTRGRLPAGESMMLDGAEIWRKSTREVLIKVRSEVLKAAGPNFLNNRGQRYRITVAGVTVAPRYVSVKEVDAADARAYLFGELEKLRSHASGIQRDVLRIGSALCMAVLNKAGYLPADVATSLLRSKALGTRMQSKTMEHQTLKKKTDSDRYRNEENNPATLRGVGAREVSEDEPQPEG